MRNKRGQERANPFLDFPHSILLHMVPLLLRQTTAFLIAIRPCAEVAQLAEHSPEKAGVGSSILPLGTISPRSCVIHIVPLTSANILSLLSISIFFIVLNGPGAPLHCHHRC